MPYVPLGSPIDVARGDLASALSAAQSRVVRRLHALGFTEREAAGAVAVWMDELLDGWHAAINTETRGQVAQVLDEGRRAIAQRNAAAKPAAACGEG